MQQSNQHIMLLCTCPDRETAASLAHKILQDSLAACINILPGIESVYRWQGKVEQDTEVLMLIKSLSRAADELERIITQNHPYELPEIITVPIDAGSNDYLQWITNNVSNSEIKSA